MILEIIKKSINFQKMFIQIRFIRNYMWHNEEIPWVLFYRGWAYVGIYTFDLHLISKYSQALNRKV